MRKALRVIRAVTCALACSGSITAFAGTVTDADLRGKKICWSNGNTSVYNKDGSYDSNRVGHGTWRLDGDVLTISAEQWAGANTITKEGATFHSTRRSGKGNKDLEQ